MSTLKTLGTILFLGAIGAGLYVYLNEQEPKDPPIGADESDLLMPEISLGDSDGFPGGDMQPTAIPPGAVEGGPPDFSASAPAGGGASKPEPTMTDRFAAPGAGAPTSNPNGGVSSAIPPSSEYATATGPVAVDPSSVLGNASPGATNPGGASSAIPSFPAGNSAPGATTGASTGAPKGVSENPSVYAATRAMVERYLKERKLAQALSLLSRWQGDTTLSPEESQELDLLLNQLAGTVIYSREHFLEPAYQVKPGETLETIASQYDVPWQLLARINGLENPTDVVVGQELKVLRGPFSATVDLDRKELVFMVDRCYAGRYPIEVGQDRKELEGTWIVNQKQINPTYYGPGGSADANDPNNPLGEHMIGLVDPQAGVAAGAFGIHGGPAHSATSGPDPRGYIRLSPEGAEEAHRILSVGSRVMIRR